MPGDDGGDAEPAAVMPAELEWAAPGEGVWWLTREHFPAPVTTLYATLFPPVVVGWSRGAARFGLPTGESRFAAVNGWLYFAGSSADPATYPSLEAAAAETLAAARWRGEVRHWFEVERPAVVDANRTLQAVDLAALDDEALAEHFGRAVSHFSDAAVLHFEHTGFDVAGGRLFQAAAGWGLDAAAVAALLAGSSPASSAAAGHVDLVVRALVDAGAGVPGSLDDVRRTPAAGQALDAYLADYGWRPLDASDLAHPTLGERPDVLLASIRARMTAGGGGSPGSLAAVRTAAALDAVRSQVPAREREQFDEYLADARLTYQLRDDDVGVCFNWPLGLVRRIVLEAAARLESRGVIDDVEDLFEARPDEIVTLLRGGGPPGAVLAGRAGHRRRAAAAEPPWQLGEPPASTESPASVPLPPAVAALVARRDAYWAVTGGGGSATGSQRGTGVGHEVVRGRACVVRGGADAIARLQPGDVMVTVTTGPTYNAVFPILAAVATEEGGLFSHAAILARELGLPAVVGVRGLLDEVRTGDLIEVDPAAGEVRVIQRAAE